MEIELEQIDKCKLYSTSLSLLNYLEAEFKDI